MASEKTAVFGAGCFWGAEDKFRKLPGVTDTAVGYCGGTTQDPAYEEVCGGETGHAEVVKVSYDPEQISYDQLVEVFFEIHDPMSMNRQGADVGSQYRSAIFTTDEGQAAIATAAKAARQANKVRPIVTEITAAGRFTLAEDYHQQYLEKKRGRKRFFGLF